MIAEYESPGRPASFSSPRAYGLSQQHKHLPEMASVAGLEVPPVFCPVVAPFYAGMEVIVPVSGLDADAAREVYAGYYAGSVVRYVDGADEGGFLSAGAYAGRDDMEISVYGSGGRCLLVARFDNLGKGASGAAIQNFNIMTGAPETAGLVLTS